MTTPLPHVILGAGGHAKVMVGLLHRLGLPVLGLTDADSARHGACVLGAPIMGDDHWAAALDPAGVLLVNGIGSAGVPKLRAKVFQAFKDRGFRFATLVDPQAVVGEDVVLGEGCQVVATAVLNPSARVGVNTIINTGAVIEHDCVVGSHCHISPRAVMCGGSRLGDLVHLGAAAAVIPGIVVGSAVVVGAGAAVVENLADGVVAVGVPARTRLENS